MKKILFICFLFFSTFSYGQVVISVSAPINTAANATSFSRGPKTYTAGKLYLWITMTTGAVNPGTISSTTLTWNTVLTVGDATRRIIVFRCMPTTTVTGETVTLNTFGGGTTGYGEDILEISGVPLGSNGANAIVQSVSGSATGADPSITMAATYSGQNAILAYFMNNANPFGGTAESGWSEDFDLGFDTPTTGFYAMRRTNTTDNTPTVTASSSDWIGVAIELRGGRRVSLIN